MKVYRLGDKLLRQCTDPSGCTTLIPRKFLLCRFHDRPHPIIVEVASEFRVRPGEIIGNRRYRPLPQARLRIIERLLAETSMTVTDIGRLLHLDHTTICYHRDRIYLASARADVGQ